MFGKNENKTYKIWHSVHINVWGGTQKVSVSPKETLVYEGSKADCMNWLKIQFIDSSVRLVDLEDIKVEIGLDFSDLSYEMTIGMHEFNDDDSIHYHSTYYFVTGK